MKCLKCKDDVDEEFFINKIECLETVGEIYCDDCFAAWAEDELTRDPHEDDHDKFGDPQKED